jgi:hypothetical protein
MAPRNCDAMQTMSGGVPPAKVAGLPATDGLMQMMGGGRIIISPLTRIRHTEIFFLESS